MSNENYRVFAELLGDSFDLEELPSWTRHGSIKVIEKDSKYWLVGELLEGTSDSKEAHDRAKEYVDLVNGLAPSIWPEFGEIELGRLKTVGADGKVAYFDKIAVVARARGKAYAEVKRADGRPDEDPNENLLSRFFESAESDSVILEVAVFLRKSNRSWTSLYSALDRIEEDIGCTVDRKQFCSATQRTRFKQTANNYNILGAKARHGRSSFQVPNNPMSFEEAEGFLLAVTKAWLLGKVQDN